MFEEIASDGAPLEADAPSPRPGLGLIGAGAFGEFCIGHLKAHFALRVFDPGRDVAALAAGQGVEAADLAGAAGQPVVLLAVPQRRIAAVARQIAPYLRPGSLVVDVCSIKQAPLGALLKALPETVAVVGTHPLFGPRSGRDGIRGLNVAVCEGRGRQAAPVARFLARRLGLKVQRTSAEEHDRQMAYVQGLTHLMARIVKAMDLPPLAQTTAAFEQLMRMVDGLSQDSEELFRTITRENPHVEEVKARFLAAASRLAAPRGG